MKTTTTMAPVTLEDVLTARRLASAREVDAIATLKTVLAPLGYTVVKAGAHPLVNGPVSATSTSNELVNVTPRFLLVPPSKPLRCPHCPRMFARPLNLGRHTAAMHLKKAKGR